MEGLIDEHEEYTLCETDIDEDTNVKEIDSIPAQGDPNNNKTQTVDSSQDQVLHDESKTPHNNVKNKNDNVTLPDKNGNCTAMCSIPFDKFMIMCNSWKSWTHYICTELPMYQLYTLTSTSRKYTCSKCTVILYDFREQWELKLLPSLGKPKPENINVGDEYHQNLITNLEEKLTAAISNVHKASYDKDILHLKTELNEEKSKSEKLSHTNINLTEKNIELREQCKFSTYLDSLNHKVDAISNTEANIKKALGLIGEQSKLLAEEVKESTNMIVNTVGTIKQNPQTTLPQNVDSLKNIEHAIVTIEQDIHSLKDNSLNDSLHSIKNQLVTISDKFKEDNFNSPPRQLFTEAQQEIYKYYVPTANRFEALQIDNSHEQSSQPSNRDKEDLVAPIKQVLMIGNSHFQRIQTPHLSFVDKCKVTKKATYDIKEATKVISDLQQDMQCVVIQSFPKDIHAETKVKYIDSLTSLFDNILAKWPKCKIIISTALFRGMSPSYNEKANAANIEVLHKFFQDPHIFVCDNSGLSSRGQPIHHFLARDNVHLSYAGKKIFAANLRNSIRDCLQIPYLPLHRTNYQQKTNNNAWKNNYYQQKTNNNSWKNSYYHDYQQKPNNNAWQNDYYHQRNNQYANSSSYDWGHYE
ncbi:unnamed protein product [Mytilus coruscus]|uniref:Zinc finger PHD-type domain-containing protein n=1 Tax=Mytilus coruscus TaxID=42192 RepID=A0A6J8B2A3_MYTCO|nr:unnamed protein product [Mytilus coruscus]